jgi:hypothetical protein
MREYAVQLVGSELNLHLSNSEIIWEFGWEPTKAQFRQFDPNRISVGFDLAAFWLGYLPVGLAQMVPIAKCISILDGKTCSIAPRGNKAWRVSANMLVGCVQRGQKKRRHM